MRQRTRITFLLVLTAAVAATGALSFFERPWVPPPCLRVISGHGRSSPVLAVSADGHFVAVAGDAAKLVDLRTYEERIVPTSWLVWSVALSPDGKTLATGASQGRIELWEVASLRPRSWVEQDGGNHVMSVSFSPDQKSLVACGGKEGE